MISFSLPWPPSVNHMYITRRGSFQRIRTETARNYDNTVYAIVHNLCKLTGNLELTIKLFPPDNRRRDIDNYNKITLDALTHAGVWTDDSQVKKLHLSMEDTDKANPRVEITADAIIKVKKRKKLA